MSRNPRNESEDHLRAAGAAGRCAHTGGPGPVDPANVEHSSTRAPEGLLLQLPSLFQMLRIDFQSRSNLICRRRAEVGGPSIGVQTDTKPQLFASDGTPAPSHPRTWNPRTFLSGHPLSQTVLVRIASELRSYSTLISSTLRQTIVINPLPVRLHPQHAPTAHLDAMNGIRSKLEDEDALQETPQHSPVKALSPPDAPLPHDGDYVTKALQFLSTATPETLGAIAVGLAAATYLILGKLGLILIGALGGVILHATWEGQSTLIGVGVGAKDRRQEGLDVVARLFAWRDAQPKDEDEDEDEGDETEHLADSFEAFRPETKAALTEFVEAVIRDYVKWWYDPILPKETSFPAASRQTLTKFMLSVSNHLSRKRPADSFLDFLTNSSSIVIVFLNELSSALSTQPASVPAAEAVYTYLSANPDSNLANVLNEKQHMKKFRMIADDILQNFLEKPAYACDPARLFLREILAGVVLDMTLKSCSKPEWINGWIVHLLEDGEPDFSQAIDVGMGNVPDVSTLSDIDGNVGNIGLAKSPATPSIQEFKKHQKRLSKAEEAMEEAMEEAKRLSQLMAEEDANKQAIRKPVDNVPKALVAGVETSTNELAVETKGLPAIPSPRTPNQTSEGFQNISTTHNSVCESPRSTTSPNEVWEASSPSASPERQESTPFTSFDQIVPPSTPVALQDVSPMPRRKTVSLTLHNANIIIHDDSTTMDKGPLRSKPNSEYLIQIEPASSDHPGWMIVRRYPDFETLHEVLRRIAKLSGVVAFSEQHSTLPNWKEHTKASLRGELERYIRDACWDRHLAESEGMKRFLEKDSQNTTAPTAKIGFGWPAPSAIETMGKGMLDVLASAPRGVADGGKALGGGISGVFNNLGKEIGNLGQKKTNGSTANVGAHVAGRASTSTLPRVDSSGSMATSIYSNRRARASEDSLRAVPLVATQPSKVPPMERRPSYHSIAEVENERESRPSTSARSSMSGSRSANHSRAPSRAPSRRGTPLNSPTQATMEQLRLPPPPSAISEDYGTDTTINTDSTAPSRNSMSTAPSQPSPGRPSISTPRISSANISASPIKQRKEPMPMTEEETCVAVELLFAVVSELYTLSSAWKFRRTLLNAAKTFLLRPGNPSLSSIQSLIQDSVIASNTSDAGIAAHLRKLRQNSLPTEEELKAWPAEMTAEEKESLRLKARKLLVQRGVPVALSGVMGQAATSEAMGRVFDCLQIEEVNRGLMFGMLLQCVRAVTQ
ncbi:PX [Glarea lozoyensis ATCC 20868]|uniref:PX n=1 Tax=Glarea lozoyensis (strain ATCC 20868 / MF5171) TaxID=1116229 RepID=S3D748_GLAL2|nr:PX [Glarea lozoyensis ATCC 20868]EPE27821.1 PX [Glarea lozoyensis ATCC 20868]